MLTEGSTPAPPGVPHRHHHTVPADPRIERTIGAEGTPGIEPDSSVRDRSQRPDQFTWTAFTATRYVTSHVAHRHWTEEEPCGEGSGRQSLTASSSEGLEHHGCGRASGCDGARRASGTAAWASNDPGRGRGGGIELPRCDGESRGLSSRTEASGGSWRGVRRARCRGR